MIVIVIGLADFILGVHYLTDVTVCIWRQLSGWGSASRLLPRLKTRFDRRAACGEWRLSLVLVVILGIFRIVIGLKPPKGV
jgi:hypothetical protein